MQYRRESAVKNNTRQKPSNKHKCKFCSKVFDRRLNLTEHMSCHTKEKPLKCLDCDKSFARKSNLERHLKMHAKQKEFKCDIQYCGQVFLGQSNFNLHLQEHGFKCEECDKSFTTNKGLYGHINALHTKEISYPCQFQNCNKVFFRPASLRGHISKHDPDRKPFKCQYCDKTCSSKGNLDTHVNGVHTKKRTYPCQIENCGKIFFYSNALTNHLMRHEEQALTFNTLTPCPICKKKVKKLSLDVHVRTHTQEKKFKCDQCSYASRYQSELNYHKKRLHSLISERELFPCDLCAKNLSTKKSLAGHINRKHLKKTFDCPFCDQKCCSKGILASHVRKHTGEKPYSCTQCDKAYRNLVSLKCHVNAAHVKLRIHPCPHCSLHFDYEYKLKRHLNVVHHEGPSFPCPSCDKVLSTAHGLQRHSAVHEVGYKSRRYNN